MADPSTHSSLLSSWFWATRPFSLSASIAPVLVGSAHAALSVRFDWLLFAISLTASIAIQVGTNLTDEYSDHRKHGGEGKLLAPHKVIQRGLLSERAVLLGIITAFSYGIAGGLIIVSQVGWPILAIGVASVAAAYLYAGGPFPLGNYGLGEPVVFLFMGPVTVMGAYYVQAQELSMATFIVSLPIAFIVTAILHCNNLRDISEDQAVGKRSIAATIGVQPSRWLFAALLAGAYISIAIAGTTSVITAWSLIGLAPAPFALATARKLFVANDRSSMNAIMVMSARVHGCTGVTLAAGLAIAIV